MKILVLTNNCIGLYSFRKEVVKAFVDRGDEVLVAAPMDEKTPDVEKLGVKIIETDFDRKGINPIADMKLMLRYRTLIGKIKPDVVLTYTIKPNLYGGMACQLCGVSQIANVTGLGTAVENPGWLQKLTIMLYKIGMRRTNTVFFQNQANMKFCQQHCMVKGKMRLIPGSGVNLQYHKLQEYPAQKEPLRFIFISRLQREKGIEEYLAAAHEIKLKYPETEFHILGACEDDYAKKMEQLQKDGIVIFHGWVDVRPYIAQACCTVHPSYYPEGMSNVLLESCAAGRPIITTNRPGCGEIVDDGVNGYIVKERDGYDVARKIEQFILLPYEKKREMGLMGRHKVEREFDRNIIVKAYLDAIAAIKA